MSASFIQKRKYKGGNKANGLSELCSTAIPVSLDIPIFTPLIKPKLGKYSILINWGLSHSKVPWIHDYYVHCSDNQIPLRILNAPWFVINSVDKLLTLPLLEQRNIPHIPYTTNKDVAIEWINDGYDVFCRTLTASYQGKGIVVAKKIEELVNAPLYTRRFKKKWEYRVHVALGETIKVQQKRRLSPEKLAERGITYSEGLVRSYNNGYIFSNDLDHTIDNEIYHSLCNISIDAVRALGLDFGAVDIGVSKSGKIAVFEVNTSPGIEGGTVNCYIEAFRRFIDEFQPT